MEEVSKALAQQQATLAGLVEMQSDLRTLLQKQHRNLEDRIVGLYHSAPSEIHASGVASGCLSQHPGIGYHSLHSETPAVAFGDALSFRPKESSSLGQSETAQSPPAPARRSHSAMQWPSQISWTSNSVIDVQKGSRRPSTEDRDDSAAAPTKSMTPAHQNVNIFRARTPAKTVDRSSRKTEEDSAALQPMRMPRKPGELGVLLRRILVHPLWDSAVGLLVLAHLLLIFLELELRSKDTARNLDIGGSFVGSNWAAWQPVFQTMDQTFDGLFFVELMFYFYAFGLVHFRRRDWVRIIDVLAVALSVLDSFILTPVLGGVMGWIGAVKALRACRIFRFVRVLRFMGTISVLRIFIETLSKSLGSLVYTTSVVCAIVVASAMFLSTVVQDVLEDKSLDRELRLWLYQYYGGAFRCTYTMFEAAFSGKWATHFSERLIWEVSPAFSIFWVAYTVLVNFAVIRVLAALFLKQTLDVAAIDAERHELKKMRERETSVETLRAIFKLGDVEEDGFLHRWEFDAMMENEEVLAMFETLELEKPELTLLYNILSEDDGVADQEEFLTGALKLKMHVTAVDIVQLLHEQLVIKRFISEMAKGLQQVDSALHPRNPWCAMAIHHHDDFAAPSTAPPTPRAPSSGVDESQAQLPSEGEEDPPLQPPGGKGTKLLAWTDDFETL